MNKMVEFEDWQIEQLRLIASLIRGDWSGYVFDGRDVRDWINSTIDKEDIRKSLNNLLDEY